MIPVALYSPFFAEFTVQARPTGDQLGHGDAGVSGDAAYPPTGGIAALLQRNTPLQNRQFRLAVAGERVVTALSLQVIEVQACAPGGDARQADHPTIVALAQQKHQQAGQGEMPQVIGRQLHLVTVGRNASNRRRHDRGVVDEHVEPWQALLSQRAQAPSASFRKANHPLAGRCLFCISLRDSFKRRSTRVCP